MAAFCTSCGAKLASAGVHFCAECGAPVKNAAAAAPAPAATPQPQAPLPQAPLEAQAPPQAQAQAPSRAAAPSVGRQILGALGRLAETAVAGGLASEVLEVVERRGFATITHPRGHDVVVGACKKDAHDPNDAHYDVHQQVDPSNLPGFVDLREWMTAVEDQGQLGSCTANAIAGAYEYLEKRTIGREGNVSRLFIYYLERKIEGTVGQDSGANLRNGMKVLQDYGACSEDTWPYDIDAFKREPNGEAFSEAGQHTVDEYRRVPVELHAMKTCLAEGYPFVFGMKIFKSFEDDGHHGRVSLPSRGDEDMGSHAMLACGYSERDQVFVVRNSWGTDWGDAGYCYVPYSYLSDGEMTHDCWTVRRAHNLDFTQSAEPGGSAHPSGRMSFFDEVVALVDGTANASNNASATASDNASATDDDADVSADDDANSDADDSNADADDSNADADDSDDSNDSNDSNDSDDSDDSSDDDNNN
jgi:Papain family cysteine protease/zinc-ribbon domain